jgi:hypothetical protein
MNKNIGLVISIVMSSYFLCSCVDKCESDDYSCLHDCDEENFCYNEDTLSEWEACMNRYCTDDTQLGDIFGQYKYK